MTVTLHLKPEVEAGLLAQAQASGVNLEEYLLALVEEAALTPGGRISAEEREARGEAVRGMLAFGEKHRLSLGEPIMRAFLHEGHRY